MEKRPQKAALDNQVRQRRQSLGLSQQALARLCGLTRQAVHAIEVGQYVPSTAVALRLARALGCPVDELFRLPDDQACVEAEWLGETSAVAGRLRCHRRDRQPIGGGIGGARPGQRAGQQPVADPC